MKLKTFARRAAAAGAVLAALTLAALPALAAPKVQVSTTNAVADHADILSDETEQYVNDVSIKLSDACGAQIGVYTLDELLGSTTMEGFAYDVFNAWGLGSDDLDNGVLLLLAPNEADGGDYYIMRGDGLESQLSFSTLGSLLDEYMEPYWVNGDYDTGTQKTVQALANRLCSIYGVTLNSSYTDTSAPDRRGPNVMGFVLLVVAVLLVIWLITYLMRPRGPRPPRGGGGGSSSGSHSHSHSYTSKITKEATCTEKGVKTFTCSCGATYTEDIPAKGHNYNNGVCSNCGDKQPEVKATEKAWDALNTKLAEIKGNNNAALVTAAHNGTAYALKLNVDAIQSGAAAFGDDFLTGLATNLKNALDDNFGSYVLTADGQDVYNKGTFQNTALKNALFSVADGFFYTLNNMTEENGVYTYKTVNAKVTGANTYAFTIAVQLEGQDVAKVKSLAGTLADHLQMEMLDSDAINSRYGITVNESKAIVVTMEMPDKLMQAGVDKIGSGENAQKAFDGDNATVANLLGIMKENMTSLDQALGSNAAEVESVLTTVNSNANVVNKVLSKMTAKVTAQDGTTANFDMTFTPSNTGNAWKDFMAGVIAMTGSDEGSVGAMKPNQFKVAQEGTYKDYYYAVPVTVTIDLDSSMGFQATETVVVVMHIDFTKYSKTGTASVSAAEPTETPAAAETSAE